MEVMMENRVEYRVLAPDSVAWYIQAALVADQNGNEHTRDLALCEAARVAAERRLVEPMKRYDCRTTGQRIDAIEAGLPPQIQVEARRMRARMRYVADVLRSARRMLDTPTEDEVDGLLLHAIGQLRMADGKDGADGSDEGRCYDCRTTGDRLAELADKLSRVDGRMLARLDALEAAARPAIANRAWMTEIERRLDVLEAHAVETDDTLSILDGRVTNDAIAGVERLQALEKRWDFLSQQFLLVMQRVDAGLPGADYMREQYDAEHDAAPISYWDMKLLAMIETVNERLGVAVGGA